MRKARERSRDSLFISSFREVDTWQLHEADNWTSPSTGPQLIWRHFPDRNVIYLKCWFLDKTEGPEEKPLTAEQRRKPTTNSSHITESLCNYNRAKQEFCTCSISSPRWNFTFYERNQLKSTTFFSFFWTDVNTDNPFCGMKQWMVVIGNGNFYPWQNRLFISIHLCPLDIAWP